jgi:hypothetical protein
MKTEKNKNKRNILLLGSSHGKDIGPMLQGELRTKFDICSIFKPNAPLAKVVEDVGKLGKSFTNQDYIITVGGSGNSQVIAWLKTIIIQLKIISTTLQRGH